MGRQYSPYFDMIGYKKLSQISLDVLMYLTDTVEANKWQVSRGMGRSYSSVYKVMDELKEGRFIRVIRTGRSSKNRAIKVKFYGITKIGLLYSLTLREKADMDKTASVHGDKLLFFRKWSLVLDDEMKDFIAMEFLDGIHRSLNLYWTREYLHRKRPDVHSFDVDKFEEECFERIGRAIFTRFIIYAYNLLGLVLNEDAGYHESFVASRETVRGLLGDEEFREGFRAFIVSALEYNVKEYNMYAACLARLFGEAPILVEKQ